MLNEMNQNKLSWPKKGREINNVSYTHTLFQCKPREVISNFNTLLPLVVTAKSVNVYGL